MTVTYHNQLANLRRLSTPQLTIGQMMFGRTNRQRSLSRALDSDDSVYTANAKSDTVTKITQPIREQTPVNNCVTPSSSATIPVSGTKRLMTPKCVTNAGQSVAVKIPSARVRGDMRTYSLECKISGKKRTTRTSAAGYGAGYC